MSKNTYESGSSKEQKATAKADALQAVIKKMRTITKFFSVPEGSTPEMALDTMQAKVVFTPKRERSCPPF